MSIDTLAPGIKRHVSNVERVHCASDVHFGNARPTNDHVGRHPAMLTRYLYELAWGQPLSPVGDASHSFDLVLNGDIFDLWKAIPDPLPKEKDLDLHSEADTLRRMEQTLDANLAPVHMLAPILFRPTEEVGAHLIILTGNHDDPVDQHPSPRYLDMLLDRITVGAYLLGLIPPTDMGRYKQNLRGRVFWTDIYENRRLQFHAQHGHRFDERNLLRRNSNTSEDLLSEGQILVESFLNPIHDLNLLTYEYSWERMRRNTHGALDDPLRRIDNFTEHDDAVQYIQAMAGSLGQDVSDLVKNHFIATMHQMDWDVLATLGSAPGLGTVAEWIYKVLPRESVKSKLRTAARLILTGQDPARTAAMPGEVRIVTFGHSHIFDKDPDTQPVGNPVESQYVNTGAWVDVLQFRSGAALAPEPQNSHRPTLVYEDAGPPRMAKVWCWDRGAWARINDVLLP